MHINCLYILLGVHVQSKLGNSTDHPDTEGLLNKTPCDNS